MNLIVEKPKKTEAHITANNSKVQSNEDISDDEKKDNIDSNKEKFYMPTISRIKHTKIKVTN